MSILLGNHKNSIFFEITNLNQNFHLHIDIVKIWESFFLILDNNFRTVNYKTGYSVQRIDESENLGHYGNTGCGVFKRGVQN